MTESLSPVVRRTVGAADIPLVWLAPTRLFRRVEDVAAYGWPLTILLTAVTLIGYATVQTGLIDREIAHSVGERIARIEAEQRDVVERSALRTLYEQEYKKGEFDRLLARIQVVVAEPVRSLGTVLLVSAALYGMVALTGRKPEWHTLMTIGVYAGFVDLLRLLTLLVLMLHYRSLEVDTSLALLTRFPAVTAGLKGATLAGITSGLSSVDPFRLWFWWIACTGLRETQQLPGWRAWVACTLCWLSAAGVRCAWAIAMVSGMGAVNAQGA